MIRKILITAFCALFASSAPAQQVRPSDAAHIYHEISGLKNLTRVLYIAAHPDDENTRLLSWLVNDQHIQTAYLSLTRGDGGQNILGTEQGPALGLIRTHELMEARKIDGAEQFFTRAIDFGFSKSPEETFRHWNEDLVTGDVVWAIRKYRPDVVICRFPPTKAAGHGHHTASAIIAEKAFEAAGNRLKYRDQLRYVQPWQPRRILFNAYRFSTTNTTSEEQMKLTVGQYNPLLGMSYGELAGKSRSIHRSQGAGTPSVPGVQTEYFQLVAGDVMVSSFMDGIEIGWNRAGRPEIGRSIDSILGKFNFLHPENSLPALLELRKKMVTVTDTFWRNSKLAELDRTVLHAAGFMAECYTDNDQATAGSQLPFTLNLITRTGNVPVRLLGVRWPGADTTCNLPLPKDSLLTLSRRISIPVSIPLTEPYWLSQPPRDGAHYPLPADSLLGLPLTPNTLNAWVRIRIGEETLDVPVPLSGKKLDPLKGDVVNPLRIIPAVSVSLSDGLLITRPDGSLQTTVRIHNAYAVSNATLTILGNNNLVAELKGISLAANTDTLIPVSLNSRQAAPMGNDAYYLSAALAVNGKTYNRSLKTISYDHLPPLQYFVPATAKVIRNNWKCSARKIGYIEGAGDLVPDILRQCGLEVDILKDADLTDASRLKQYDAIVTGVRVLNTEPRMAWWMPVLLRYAEQGGTLVMQYNNLKNLATTEIGPYPVTLSNLRVTEEDAAVSFTDPDHRLLQSPNRITQEDFKGWVQERGLNFASGWDKRYQPLFRMNDQGEDPLEGGTLYAAYGKGHYIYTPLSFFRQLPAGNKGALRLFMNMLSIRK